MLSTLTLTVALTTASVPVGCDFYFVGPYYYPPCYTYAPVYYVQMPYIVPCFPVEVVVESAKDKKEKSKDTDAMTKLEKKLDALTDLLLNFEKRLDRLEKRLDKLEKDAAKSTSSKDSRWEEKNLGQRAVVTVRLPADAELYLDGQKTRSNNQPVRTILTPELEPGASYSYDLSAKFVRDGQTITQSRRITFQAGRQLEVTFGDLEPNVLSGR